MVYGLHAWKSFFESTTLIPTLLFSLLPFCTLMWFQLNKSFVKLYQSFSNSLLMCSNNCFDGSFCCPFYHQFLVNWFLQVDSLASLMLVLITLIYTVVNVFSTDYLIGDSHYIQFHGSVSLFSFGFSLLILSNNLVAASLIGSVIATTTILQLMLLVFSLTTHASGLCFLIISAMIYFGLVFC